MPYLGMKHPVSYPTFAQTKPCSAWLSSSQVVGSIYLLNCSLTNSLDRGFNDYLTAKYETVHLLFGAKTWQAGCDPNGLHHVSSMSPVQQEEVLFAKSAIVRPPISFLTQFCSQSLRPFRTIGALLEDVRPSLHSIFTRGRIGALWRAIKTPTYGKTNPTSV